jgi:transcriptional regulator with XRE-family HTH domain
MAAKRRIFAGEKLKSLRAGLTLRQSDMAERLGISVSYLSQIEHDDRPLTPALLETLARVFPLDWNVDEEDTTTRRFAALREAAADPLFANPLSAEQLARIAEQQPALADQFAALHQAYTQIYRVIMPAVRACHGRRFVTGFTTLAIMSMCLIRPQRHWATSCAVRCSRQMYRRLSII